MKFPFVSRERLDEEKARVVEEKVRSQKLEAEVERLRELLLARPVPPAPLLGPDTDLSKVQPIAGKPTIAMVTAFANQSAFKRSQTVGAKGVAQEVEENEIKRRRVTSGN